MIFCVFILWQEENPKYEVSSGDRLHFVKFETKYIEACLDFVQQNLVASADVMKEKKIKVTGGGAYKVCVKKWQNLKFGIYWFYFLYWFFFAEQVRRPHSGETRSQVSRSYSKCVVMVQRPNWFKFIDLCIPHSLYSQGWQGRRNDLPYWRLQLSFKEHSRWSIHLSAPRQPRIPFPYRWSMHLSLSFGQHRFWRQYHEGF